MTLMTMPMVPVSMVPMMPRMATPPSRILLRIPLRRRRIPSALLLVRLKLVTQQPAQQPSTTRLRVSSVMIPLQLLLNKVGR